MSEVPLFWKAELVAVALQRGLERDSTRILRGVIHVQDTPRRGSARSDDRVEGRDVVLLQLPRAQHGALHGP